MDDIVPPVTLEQILALLTDEQERELTQPPRKTVVTPAEHRALMRAYRESP